MSKIFDEEVRDVERKLAKADGAFGRRRYSRGLWGFFDQEQVRRRKRRPIDNSPVAVPRHDRLIGFTIVKHG